MEITKLNCKYCNVEVSYIGTINSLAQEIWDSEHENCRDFLYVYKINVRKKKEVEIYEPKSD